MSRKSFDKRERDDPLFAQLVEHGRLCSQSWWLEQARAAMKAGAKPQAYQFWIAVMKNRFGWADKVEMSDGKEAKDMSTDEINAKIKTLQDKMKKLPTNVELSNLLKGNVN